MLRLTFISRDRVKLFIKHIGLAYCTALPRRVLLILLLSLLSVWGAALWGYHNWSTQSRRQHQTQLSTHVATQFRRYETVLLGCRGLYRASEKVTQSEWTAFVNGLQIDENYRALTDLAIIRLKPIASQSTVSNSSKKDSANWQAVIQQNFCFRNEQPDLANRFDLSKLIRQELINSAVNNNFACLPTIPMGQCSGNTATLLLPFFKKGHKKTNFRSLARDIEGWIAATVDLDMILVLDELHLPADETIKLLYLGSGELTGQQLAQQNFHAKANGKLVQTTHYIAGSTWAIQITNQTRSVMNMVLLLLNGVFIASVIISILISTLLGASISNHQHAMQIIDLKSKALDESEQRTRNILDTSHDAFFTCNFSGHIIDWSHQAEKLFGYDKNEILGKTLIQTILPNRKQQSFTLGGLRKIFAGTDTGQRVELTAQNRDGKIFPVELAISPMQSKEGIVFNVFIHDISQRKQLQSQLSHAQKLESIGGLAAGIAHEINTPTQYVGDNTRFLKDAFIELEEAQTALLKFVDAIKDNPQIHDPLQELQLRLETLDLTFLREEIPSAITQSLEGINRVAEIVRSMKNFAHPGTQTKQLCDLNQAIKSTCVVSCNVWKYIAKLQTELDPQLPQVNCTPGEINQVILNLIVNASHAIEEKQQATADETLGLITITTQRVGQHVQIQVIDTGNGIPQSIRDRVFDPFITTKKVGKGTGQGLAIAHTVIVDKHQGKITFESEIGIGTTFTILLPIDSELTENDDQNESQKNIVHSQTREA